MDDLLFFKHSELATIPTRATPEAAGWDLYATHDVCLEPWSRSCVMTGLSARSPSNTYMRLAPRSGHAVRHGIDVMAGVVDRDYKGEIGVVLMNLSPARVELSKTSPIAQLIVESYHKCNARTLSLSEFTGEYSERGNDGFGSTDGQNALSLCS